MTTRYRRPVISLAGFVLMLGLMGSSLDALAIPAFLAAQIASGLDLILYLLGRFSPKATLWAIRVERFLGPLPWKTP